MDMCLTWFGHLALINCSFAIGSLPIFSSDDSSLENQIVLSVKSREDLSHFSKL